MKDESNLPFNASLGSLLLMATSLMEGNVALMTEYGVPIPGAQS